MLRQIALLLVFCLLIFTVNVLPAGTPPPERRDKKMMVDQGSDPPAPAAGKNWWYFKSGYPYTRSSATIRQFAMQGTSEQVAFGRVDSGSGSGIARIGTLNTDWGVFANSSFFSVSQFAVGQDSSGITYLNGQQVIIRNQNNNVAIIYPSEIQLQDAKLVESISSTTLAAGASSFSMASRNAAILTGDTAGNTITGISNVGTGMSIDLLFTNDKITINDSGIFKLNGNFTSSADDVLSLRFDGTNFWERYRSTN